MPAYGKMQTYGKNADLRSGNIINIIKAEVFKPLLFCGDKAA